jgi:hypothetical protein
MTARDKAFAELLRRVWIDFAKNGKIEPTTIPGIEWPPMNGVKNDGSYPTMLLDPMPSVATNWRKEECNFWRANGFYPYGWSS